MNCTLSFRYEFSRDDDDFGWLAASLRTPQFSGRNGMWVQWQDLSEFAEALSRYPIDAAGPVECNWGFGGEGGYSPVTRVRVRPAAVTGPVAVEVLLADHYQPDDHCRTRFETDYPALLEFQRQLRLMMRREGEEAVLKGFRQEG